MHFLISATPRGGFSGGVAIHEDGDALGVVTSSLHKATLPAELGFLAVLSVEPILQCLSDNGLLPSIQKEHHDKLMGLDSEAHHKPETGDGNGRA